MTESLQTCRPLEEHTVFQSPLETSQRTWVILVNRPHDTKAKTKQKPLAEFFFPIDDL